MYISIQSIDDITDLKSKNLLSHNALLLLRLIQSAKYCEAQEKAKLFILLACTLLSFIPNVLSKNNFVPQRDMNSMSNGEAA